MPEDPEKDDEKIIVRDVKYFPDTHSAVIVLSNGDIVNATGPDHMAGQEPAIEIVGSLDDKIEDAKWSPDEEILAIVTAKTFVLLSRVFDPLSESAIDIEDLKISRHVSVGWGKAETQFQGKGAKAMRDPTVPIKVDQGHVCPDDDMSLTLSWRGDGEYISLTSVDKSSEDLTRRTIRVYSRAGALSSVSEPVDSMENQVAWRPSGNVIAAVQRNSHNEDSIGPDLIFFERNGLRRYEFSLRIGESDPVADIAWNVDSDILAVQLRDRIQLWTTKNYHWYLKQEVFPKIKDCTPNWMLWHPEKPQSLLIAYKDLAGQEHLEVHQFLWTLFTGSTYPPYDSGTNCVIDGAIIKATPLSIANTPPPMAFRSFKVDSTPIYVSVSQTSSKFAMLFLEELVIAQWDLTTKPIKAPIVKKTLNLPEVTALDMVPKQVAFVGDDTVAIAGDMMTENVLVVINLNTCGILATHYISPDVYILKSQADGEAFIYETIDGSVYILEDDYQLPELVYKLPQRCDSVEVSPGTEDGELPAVFGLSANGKLFANGRLLSPSVTSLLLTKSHALFTTAQHYVKFGHLNPDVEKITIPADDVENDERCRSIERGSLLTAVMPSKTSLVLQAPRGNLETIHPRILVLSEVRKDIDNKEYYNAFASCRVNRVDLNILYDYSPEQFLNNIELFISQLGKVEYIDLFLSDLKNEDVSQTMYKQTLIESTIEGVDNVPSLQTKEEASSKINRVCDAILSVLLGEKYKTGYLQSIFTAYAFKSPPDLESALNLVSKDRSSNPDQAEKSVQHLSFLQDVELLYNTSLGLYDLDLALLVAQQSQKDPKEYLPFLQELQEQSLLRRKFMIDEHLQRYSKALGYLSEMNDTFDELLEFMETHNLYKDALAIYRRSEEKQNSILRLYASHLQGQTLYTEAGMTYENLGDYDDALDAYQLAGAWERALSLVQRSEYNQEKKDDVAIHMSEMTLESRKYYDSAIIQLDYLHDIGEALRSFCKGLYFEDALRTIMLKDPSNTKNYYDDIIDPGLLEGFGQISELLSDCKGQVNSQVKRLRELREKKANDPLEFFGGPEASDAPDNVSIAPSETSTAPSFFTRYTGKTGGTAQTGTSRKTSKNRRREERKKARGKKGSVYEEEYLINSVRRLLERLDQTRPESERLIDGLIRRHMRDHAYQIQKMFVEVLDILRQVVEEVFTLSERDRERYDDDGNVYYIPQETIPTIQQFPKRQILDY